MLCICVIVFFRCLDLVEDVARHSDSAAMLFVSTLLCLAASPFHFFCDVCLCYFLSFSLLRNVRSSYFIVSDYA